jgi:hypothetical protein
MEFSTMTRKFLALWTAWLNRLAFPIGPGLYNVLAVPTVQPPHRLIYFNLPDPIRPI